MKVQLPKRSRELWSIEVRETPIVQNIRVNKISGEVTAAILATVGRTPWWILSHADHSARHVEEHCSIRFSRLDSNYGSHPHIVKEKLAGFHMTFFGPLNLKWKDVFNHVTVNFKPVCTWHNILILHLRNTSGFINNSFDMFQCNNLSLLFMFLEMEKKK